MSLVTKNNVVACTPIAIKADDNKHSLALVTKRMKLVPLSVVYPTDPSSGNVFRVTVDDVIYVKAECVRSVWATEVYQIEGDVTQFILVPLSEVVFVDKGAKKVN